MIGSALALRMSPLSSLETWIQDNMGQCPDICINMNKVTVICTIDRPMEPREGPRSIFHVSLLGTAFSFEFVQALAGLSQPDMICKARTLFTLAHSA